MQWVFCYYYWFVYDDILHYDLFQRDVAIDKLVEPNNTYPYIIALGDSKKEIINFYIEV